MNAFSHTEPELKPDVEDIVRHLRALTYCWHELGEDCLIEIVLLTDDDVAQVKNVQHFEPTPEGIRAAAEHAAAMNRHHLNAYVTVNPVSATNRPPAGKRAKTEHIIASCFHFADGDDAGASARIRSFVGPKPTFWVNTGLTPYQRAHPYWALEIPTRNLPAWTQTQKAIAVALGTDGAVVDPPRIMRLAGTVNWPKAKKQAKGYVPELVTLHFPKEERDPIPAEDMARAFAVRAEPKPNATFINTGPSFVSRSADDYADILRRARTDGEKHGGVRDLAASLAGQGVSRAFAEALIKELCPVWDAGVEKLIASGYEKYHQQGSSTRPDFDAGSTTGESAVQFLTTAEFLARWSAKSFLLKGIIEEGRLLTLCGPTGTGKTAVALLIALHIALQRMLAGLKVRQAGVLFLAGENPDDVRTRWLAMLRREMIDPATVDVRFIEGRFSIEGQLEAIRAHLAERPAGLVIADTLQAFFTGDNSNDNEQMKAAAFGFREITKMGPAVLVPAHPVKGASKDRNVPYGGGALLNEVDGNLSLWGSQTSVELHWCGKFRGSFEPLHFALEVGAVPDALDADGDPIRTVTARTLAADEAETVTTA